MNFNPFKRSKKYDLSKASPELSQKDLIEFNKQRPLGPQALICHAPFKSVYFAHYGKAVACCWNRSFVLGQYPQQSVRDIWFGQRAEEFRKYITMNNLDHGCEGCKSHILAGSYDVAKAKMYDQNKLNANKFPSVMEFELSNTCNLECEMCSGDFSSLIRKNREGRAPLEEPYDDAFVEQLEEFIPYLEEVKFYGGEPFLVEIYYKIWEKIIKLNPDVRITVQTNATILNNRVKRIMEQSQFHLGLSIDSFNKENYERIRKNAKYETTMANIEWFRNYCEEHNTYFGIAACAMQQNWHELADFVRRCNALNAQVSLHTVFFPKKSSFQSLEREKLESMVEIMSKEEFPDSTPIEVKNRHHYRDLIKRLEHLIQEKKVKVPQVGKMEDLSDLRQFADQFIDDHPVWTDSVKAVRRKQVRSKLEQLGVALGKDFDYQEAFGRLDFNSPFLVQRLLNDIEVSSVAELISVIKSGG